MQKIHQKKKIPASKYAILYFSNSFLFFFFFFFLFFFFIYFGSVGSSFLCEGFL